MSTKSWKDQSYRDVDSQTNTEKKVTHVNNGGAIVVLVAFLGNILPKGIKILPEKLEGIFYYYSRGLCLALVCLLFAYIFQVIELEYKPRFKRTALSLRIFAMGYSQLLLFL